MQEEVGLYGATMIAQTIKPNIAIVTDVTHDTTHSTYREEKRRSHENGDDLIAYAPSVHHIIRDLITDTAKKRKFLSRETL